MMLNIKTIKLDKMSNFFIDIMSALCHTAYRWYSHIISSHDFSGEHIMKQYSEWLNVVRFLIFMAGADPDACEYDFQQAYSADYGCMEAARAYLAQLQAQMSA